MEKSAVLYFPCTRVVLYITSTVQTTLVERCIMLFMRHFSGAELDLLEEDSEEQDAVLLLCRSLGAQP